MDSRELQELKNLGEKICKIRQSKKIFQEKCAELAEIDRTYISGLERGKRNPSYLVLKRLCKVLEISAQVLFQE